MDGALLGGQRLGLVDLVKLHFRRAEWHLWPELAGGGDVGVLRCSDRRRRTKPVRLRQKAHYFGVAFTSLAFTPSTGQCTTGGSTFGGPGVIVKATGTYNFNAMLVNIPVSMSTQACYPLIQ